METDDRDGGGIACPKIGKTRAQCDEAARFAVYVAAAASDTERVQGAIRALKRAGFVVTCTWPEVIATTPGGSNPRDASHSDRRCWSVQDLSEIDAAHAIWFLVPEPPSTTRGGWFEAGYAYAEHKHLLFSGDVKQSIFCALGLEFETDGGAFAHLHKLRVELGLAELCANAPHDWPGPYELDGGK